MADGQAEPLQRIPVEATDLTTAMFRAGQAFDGVRELHPTATYITLTVDPDQAWRRIAEEGHDDQWQDA
ncbi:hypothetical protein Q8W71_16110 [Methylobacterium sp. NEAU 140]|uniref:hypothetical protein n=1 Tax=Methylobacterium sp. NEAU 140 TaxID=3064945 RepID=UPI002736F907|nr:hypothetical protein [Methylobacterium sp. NEAU 140]MDP4024154.1 hypothetical protein [Methylobacterium sp. NEAU 140]